MCVCVCARAQCVQEGVRYLMKMLQVRSSVKLSDGVVFHDSNTANLLTEGTHSHRHPHSQTLSQTDRWCNR